MRVDDRKVAVRRRIAIMLVVVVVVFVVCIIPDDNLHNPGRRHVRPLPRIYGLALY